MRSASGVELENPIGEDGEHLRELTEACGLRGSETSGEAVESVVVGVDELGCWIWE